MSTAKNFAKTPLPGTENPSAEYFPSIKNVTRPPLDLDNLRKQGPQSIIAVAYRDLKKLESKKTFSKEENKQKRVHSNILKLGLEFWRHMCESRHNQAMRLIKDQSLEREVLELAFDGEKITANLLRLHGSKFSKVIQTRVELDFAISKTISSERTLIINSHPELFRYTPPVPDFYKESEAYNKRLLLNSNGYEQNMEFNAFMNQGIQDGLLQLKEMSIQDAVNVSLDEILDSIIQKRREFNSLKQSIHTYTDADFNFRTVEIITRNMTRTDSRFRLYAQRLIEKNNWIQTGKIGEEIIELGRVVSGNSIKHTPVASLEKIKNHIEYLVQNYLGSYNEKSPSEILASVAQIYWWMANGCLLYSGSASVSDAFSKLLLDLAEVPVGRWKENISPDLEAMLTNMEEFIQRFPDLMEDPNL